MIDLRILKSALEQLEQERGIPKAKTVEKPKKEAKKKESK